MDAEDPPLGRLMDLVGPPVARLMGPHINRRTVENVHRAELVLERVEDLEGGDIFKPIVARAMPIPPPNGGVVGGPDIPSRVMAPLL